MGTSRRGIWLNLNGVKGIHDLKDRTAIYGLSTLIMSSLVFTGKTVSKQLRPDGSDRSSFPSGHTATAFAAAEFLRMEYKDSPWYGVAGYAVAAATGYLRMYNNKHWFSDVVTGAGVGILSTDIAYQLFPSIKRLLQYGNGKTTTVVIPFYKQGAIGLTMMRVF